MDEYTKTFYLFNVPTFGSGLGRIMDWGQSMSEYNSSPSIEMADYLATLSDWSAVGDDLRDVMGDYESVAE